MNASAGGRRALAVIAGVLLTACEVAPTRPSVMVLPGTGKSLEQFHVEDVACQQWAVQEIGGGPGAVAGQRQSSSLPLQERYDIAYMQCMFAKGNRIPVRRGSSPPATSTAPNPPTAPELPPPAGTPPPPPPGASGRE